MAVQWTPHRFSGGTLALDTANTVVLRNDPVRSFDRFDDRREIARFAQAASHFRASELGGRPLAVADAEKAAPAVLAIREATDVLFRGLAEGGAATGGAMATFLSACAAGFSDRVVVGPPSRPFGDPSTPLAYETALAVSALALLCAETMRRIRICANCCWLFLDGSRNGSRIWCDMAVCGNRQKARRHYRRRTAATKEHFDA